MNIDNLYTSAEFITKLIDRWRSKQSVEAIERDIVLQKLSQMYESLRFDTQSVGVDDSVEEPVAETLLPLIEPPFEVAVDSVLDQVSEEVEQSEGESVEVAVEDVEISIEAVAEPEQELEPEQPLVVEEDSLSDASTVECALYEADMLPKQQRSRLDSLLALYEEEDSQTDGPVVVETEVETEIEEVAEVSEQIADIPDEECEQVIETIIEEFDDEEEEEEDVQDAVQEPESQEITPSKSPFDAFISERGESLSDRYAADDSHHTIGDLGTVAQGATFNSMLSLNDRYQIIAELFEGDAEAFAAAIEVIDSSDDFDDVMIYLAEHYTWNSESEAAKLLLQILKRKFGVA